jgi:hypothetical protein
MRLSKTTILVFANLTSLMKFAIAMLLFIANFSTTAVLLSGNYSVSPTRKNTSLRSIDIKWGEGSEGGAPETSPN